MVDGRSQLNKVMANLFKRRSAAGAAEVRDLTESETALAQSTYNVEKITEIQGRFTGGEVSADSAAIARLLYLHNALFLRLS